MRKLAWAALPFAAAIFLAQYLLPAKGLPYISAALLLLLPFEALLRGNKRKKAALLCLGMALGFGWFWAHDRLFIEPCRELEGKTLWVWGRVTDQPVDHGDYCEIDLYLTGGTAAGNKMLLLCYDEAACELQPGDMVRAEVRLTEVSDSRLAEGYRLQAYGSQGNLEVVGRWRWAWLYFPRRLAYALRDLCAEIFPEKAAPFMVALMTGDKSLLREEAGLYSAMSTAGVLHIVAVSGLHLSYVVAFVQMLLGKGRRASLLCGLMILVFVLMTGCTPSVLRAAVMQILLLLAPLFDREGDSATSLSAALGLLLLVNPRACASLSLQLSFAAVAGIELTAPAMRRWQHRRPNGKVWRYIKANVACSLGASIFTVPLVAWYFGQVCLLAVLSNLLTLWAIPMVFCAGYILCALGLLWPAGGMVLAWAPSLLVFWCEAVYTAIAKLPFAAVYTDDRLVVLWLLLSYGLFGGFWLFGKKGRAFRAGPPAALSLMALCLVLIAGRIMGPRGAFVSALDVGQGACTVLMEDDAVVLVDCGGYAVRSAGDTAANYVLSRGQSDVDLLVLTHLHEDHVNGVERLLQRIPVGCILLPQDASDDDGMLQELLSAAEESGTDVAFITTHTKAAVGDMELMLYLPLAGETENERGLALRADVGESSVLITGDMDMNGELALALLGAAEPVDVFLVGHHGSRYSSSHYLLDALRPDTAIISVGENNYGHPARETLERLFAYAGEVRMTGQEGTITVRMD